LNGQYAFTGLPLQGMDLVPRSQDTTRAAISSLDAAHTLQAAVGLRVLTPDQARAADVTGNGAVSALDASRILQFTVGAVPALPVAESCDSDWLFAPRPAAAPNQELVDPVVGAAGCAPGCIRYAPLTASATGQDFVAIAFGDVTGNWTETAAQVTGQAPAVVIGTTARTSGGKLRLPVYVSAAEPFNGLELVLRYAPATLDVASVRLAQAPGGTMIATHSPAPGVVRIAAAGAAALNPSGRTTVIVTFEPDGHTRTLAEVRVDDARVER